MRMFEGILGMILGVITWLIKALGWVVKTIVGWVMALPKEVMAVLIFILGVGVLFFAFYQQAEHTITSRVTFYLIALFLIVIIVFVLANLAGHDILNVLGI